MTLQPIRILHLIYSLDASGAERIVHTLASKINQTRFKAAICAIKRGGSLVEEIERDKIKVFIIEKNRGFDFSVMFKLKQIIKDESIDIVHSHNFSANMWGRLSVKLCPPCRIITTEHSLSIRKGLLRKCIDRILLPFSDRIIAVSNAVCKSLIEEETIPIDRITTIYNGISLDEFKDLRSSKEVRKELGIDLGAPIIGIVARLIYDKGHRFFIDAARMVLEKFPTTIFLIVGDGELTSELKKYVIKNRLKDSIFFTGYRKDRLDLMNVFTISVLSSIREGLPVTLLEYMALKKPIIVTNVGGMPEVIYDGHNGRVVPKRDTNALANCILELLSNENSRIRLGENAYNRVASDFSQATMIKKIQDLYEGVLNIN